MTGIFAEHHGYLSDTRRSELYARAIARSIEPGDVVVDLGCGFGLLGLMCLEAGAARVYGIEESAALDITQETVSRAGLKDQYLCLSGSSFEITLPEKADVLICDHVGYFGVDYGIVEMLADASRRFLKPGGKILPAGADLKLAAVRSNDLRRRLAVWDGADTHEAYNWLRSYAINTKHPVDLEPGDLATPATLAARIDFAAAQPSTITASAALTIDGDGPVDGIAGWFDCTLAHDVTMTNAPGAPGRIARHQIFLGFDTPFEVCSGDTIDVAVKVRHADSVLAWAARVPRTGQQAKLSTWASLPISESKRQRPGPGPRGLSTRGEVSKAVLDAVDGCRSAAEIEERVLAKHPDLFPDPEHIRRFVRAELARSSR